MESELIARLRQRISALPELRLNDATSQPERMWAEFRAGIRSALLAKDPRTFLHFDVIKATMFVDDPPYIALEYDYLRGLPDWRDRWRPAIEEANRVLVPRCPYYPRSSGNLIHHAFHLARFEFSTGLNVAQFATILEFGGGYGAMCKLIHNMGFHGRYLIFDLPEFSALQEFYLRVTGTLVNSRGRDSIGITCFSEFSQFKHITDAALIDLFLATWSISETPLEFRRQVLDNVRATHWLLAYQEEFRDVNNSKFFREWSQSKPNCRWKNVSLEHMPNRNSYLFGTQTRSA